MGGIINAFFTMSLQDDKNKCYSTKKTTSLRLMTVALKDQKLTLIKYPTMHVTPCINEHITECACSQKGLL